MNNQLENYLIIQKYDLLISNERSFLYKKKDINLLITKKADDLIIEFFTSLIDYVICSQKIKYLNLDDFKIQEQEFKKLTKKQKNLYENKLV